MDHKTDLTRRVAEFLDGRTDSVMPSSIEPTITPSIADHIASRARAVDWLRVFRKRRPLVSAVTDTLPQSESDPDTVRESGEGQWGGEPGSLATDMLYEAVRVTAELIVSDSESATIRAGLDALDVTNRKRLARAIAVRLWGSCEMDVNRARFYWPIAADVIRRLLRARADAEATRLKQQPIGEGERANVGDTSLPIALKNHLDWANIDTRWTACHAKNSMSAVVFALREFTGLGWTDIAAITGITKEGAKAVHDLAKEDIFLMPVALTD